MVSFIDCIIYYGMEIPDARKTRALPEGFVVLQDYHPICAEGLFSAFFPTQRRYVYWNPTRLEASVYAASEPGRLPALGADPVWDTVLLDLRQAPCRDYVVERALRLLTIEGVHGLFVDDGDSWGETPEARQTLLSVLDAVEERWPKPFGYFFNRGFPFWHHVPRLEAVMLEGLSPYEVQSAAPCELQWIENVINLHLAVLATRPETVPVFALSYDAVTPADQASDRTRRLRIAAALSRHLTRTLVLERRLDAWPVPITL